MNEVRLWSLKQMNGKMLATLVNGSANTETESLLEELLVANPSLLEDGLQLVGRQLPTSNGPLDLVGIDRNGRLVVFELKRGTLTRDAVAQVIDYASDLHLMARDDLARHVQERSGKSGIMKIDDFNAWYDEEFPDKDDEFPPPRMVLVGLGVEARTKRMVQFLADAGLQIELSTFHVFDEEGRRFVARQVEVSDSPNKRPSASRGATRQSVEDAVMDKAVHLGVDNFFNDAREFIAEHLKIRDGGSPNKGGITYYRRAWAEDPKGPGRAYASLLLEKKHHVLLVLTFRALREGGNLIKEFIEREHAKKGEHWAQHYEQYELSLNHADWLRIRDQLGQALDAVAAGIADSEDAAASVES